MTRGLNNADDLLELINRLCGDHELILQEARWAVGAVPFAEHVQRMVELREVLDLAAIGAGFAVPQFADRAEGIFVGQPVGKHVGQRK
ncbi:Uncharacterised protein [Mycobacterium tuberculosis]|nr:Uncharacterised protein [Mycobacterium tuberculosis]COX44382.1 Uncharacterised protein [Mycobacterium tuberculosis]